jgi:hypothetical protein
MSVPSWARVGAKVVCVDDGTEIEPEWDNVDIPSPYVGAIVTIENAGVADDGVVVLRFVEYPDAECPIKDYRPLITRTQAQDVRAIKSMLRELPAETRLDRLLEALDE